ncbi:unnamed protein product, partial [Mesorhabditis spiculigera]
MPDIDEQAQELEVIESIFQDLISIVDGKNLRLSLDGFTASISLPPEYPSSYPPEFTISAPTWSQDQKRELQNELNDAYVENIGMPILFSWISIMKDFTDKVNGLTETQTTQDSLEDIEDEEPSSSQEIERSDLTLPTIYTGETFHDRKSIFQAHMARVNSKAEVEAVMQKLLQNNKIAKATHNILAWRCNEMRNGKLVSLKDCEDDGETHASAKMLDIIEKMGAENVMVVVTRWYGGVHLGPDRFRIINNLTRAILAANGMENRR